MRALEVRRVRAADELVSTVRGPNNVVVRSKLKPALVALEPHHGV